MPALSPETVLKTLKQFFPEKNNDCKCAYIEELKELNDFGVTTEEHLVVLLKKRAEEVMEIDRSPMSDFDLRMWIQEEGKEAVEKRLRGGYWFSFPGLLRITLELEFGKAYEAYAEKRDGIT